MKKQAGFTIVELLITVAIVAILVMIAYPSYQNYVVRTKRADMMTELQNIGRLIESQKLSLGRADYQGVNVSSTLGDYPKNETALYTVTIQDRNRAGGVVQGGLNTGRWLLTATPKTGTIMENDGVLTLRHNGQKCRASACGMSDEWRN